MDDNELLKHLEPTRLDRAVGVFSPSLMLGRVKSRAKVHLFRYEAARRSRLRASATQALDPESPQYQRDRWELIKQSRDLIENFPLFYGIQRKLAAHTVGNLKVQMDTDDAKLDTQIETYLRESFAYCDITGRHDLSKLAELALMASKSDGDCGFIIHTPEDSEFVKLQSIESDRIGDPQETGFKENEFGGIKIDESGRPIFYDIYSRSRLSQRYEFESSIPAINFLHVFDPFRLSQYRGVTAYASVIKTALDVKEIMEGIRIRTKFAAYLAALVTTENGEPSASNILSAQASSSGGRIPEEETKFGILKYLSPGDKVEEFKNDFPSSAVQQALDRMVREIAVALNLPYGLVWDMSGMRGPGARFEAAQAERTLQHERSVLQCRLLDPYVRRAIIHGISIGRIDADYDRPNLFRHNWQWPRHLTIDVGREGRLDLELFRAGLLSEQEYFSEEGLDWKEVNEQIFEERAYKKQLADKFGIDAIDQRNLTTGGQLPVEVDVDGYGVVSSVGSETDGGKASESATPAGSGEIAGEPLVQKIGVGGTQSLMEILSMHAQGIIETGAAKQVLMIVFGLGEEKADRLLSGDIPEEVSEIIPDDAKSKDLSAKIDLTPPKGAIDNARKVLKWKEDHASEIKGMTQTGWTRARQIADGKPLTEETVKRMSSFNRHRKNGTLNPESRGKPWTDAGYVAWLGWGGTVGIDWAMRKSKQIQES